jgi:putative ABC transport system substrate-binding protein
MRLHTVILVVTFALAILSTPHTTQAQPPVKIPRLGWLSAGSPPATSTPSPFVQGLRDLGYVEGQNIVLEYRYAEGNLDRLPALAAELVRLPVAILVAGSAAGALAAKHATTTIPIVFHSTGDPVGRGLVTSLGRPGGNITGTSFDVGSGAEFKGKLLELLKDAVPTISRVANLGYTRALASPRGAEAKERAARVLGLTIRHFSVQRSEDLTEQVFPAITADAPAIDALLAEGAAATASRRQIADFALQHRLPTIGNSRVFADAGFLLSYGPTQREMQQRAAVLVHKILQGATPADLPVEQPTQFELVINLKTAKALGITIPPTLLFQAAEVIQ